MRPGKKILTYVVIFLTAWLSALSYILFVFPNNFAPAGINGLCTMIQYALGIRVSIMNLLVNLVTPGLQDCQPACGHSLYDL